MGNPLLGHEPLPLFGRIRPEHVEPGIGEMLRGARERVAAIETSTPASFASVVEPLEELQHEVNRVWSPVRHLNAVMNSETLRNAYNSALGQISDFQTDLAQSEPIYRAYSAIKDSQKDAPLSALQQRVIELALRDFRLAGVALPQKSKERFKTVMLELTQLQSKFEENVLDATRGWSYQVTDGQELAGLNEKIVEQPRKKSHEQHLEGWTLTLSQPT